MNRHVPRSGSACSALYVLARRLSALLALPGNQNQSTKQKEMNRRVPRSGIACSVLYVLARRLFLPGVSPPSWRCPATKSRAPNRRK
ncbi:hypothetical protein NDU88_011252 [Pleurodeles waltl]|uniref:Uncharacterized protein n=1 Tax=Pleurodeles waltl TaxID=8319 RepID=A0AAV7PX90_PLEWA|nr:hypothetical protein NDU88_011252 [Pleurodeles waltl]